MERDRTTHVALVVYGRTSYPLFLRLLAANEAFDAHVQNEVDDDTLTRQLAEVQAIANAAHAVTPPASAERAHRTLLNLIGSLLACYLAHAQDAESAALRRSVADLRLATTVFLIEFDRLLGGLVQDNQADTQVG